MAEVRIDNINFDDTTLRQDGVGGGVVLYLSMIFVLMILPM